MFRTAYRLPFRLLGIPVHLDVTFLLILPILAWMIGRNVGLYIEVLELPIDPTPLQEGMTPFLLGFIAAIGLFVSILVHELGHCVVARRYGVYVKRIILWVLGGLAQFERLPRRRGAEALIAIAGPITSFLVGALCWILFLSVRANAMLAFVFAYLSYMNVFLAAFNLLPALPLDGGRVLRSLLALRVPYLRATQVSASISKSLAVLMGLLGFVFFNVFFVLIAFFVYMAVSGESQIAAVSEMLQGIYVQDVMTRKVKTVRPDLGVSDLLQRMLEERHLGYPVLDESGEMVGIITLDDVRGLGSSQETRNITANEIMSREISTIKESASAWEAFQKMSQNNFRRLMVVDSNGRLTGILSKTDLIRAIQVRTVGSTLETSGPRVGGSQF